MVCIPPVFLDLHLKRISNGESLVVHMWTAPMKESLAKNTPHEARGQWCSAENHCETVETSITFKKFNLEKQATGNYVVAFADGHEQKGTLSVVRKPYKKPFLCM